MNRFGNIALAFIGTCCVAQEWPFYGGDPGGMRYSSLRQIDRTNVQRLKPVWAFHTGDVSDGTRWAARSSFETTPLVIDGVMYFTTPFARVFALNAETGAELWSFDPRIDRIESSNMVNRGVAYWTDGRKRRVFLGTTDGRLFSLIAETGKPDDSFGLGGWIDLRRGIADKYPDRRAGMTSPPAIYRNLVICGSIVPDGEPRGPVGDVRAFDANTGKLVWTFGVVPRPGEFGGGTWEGDSWRDRGGVNAWAPLSVDVERGVVFLPLTSPATDNYGGDRKGAGLFGDSLVAVDAASGRRLWHFQTVHHDLWDYDLPAQPSLVRILKNGKLLDAVAQIAKTGYTFVFDRATGEPVFPIEEAPAPKSEIPGESAWPTQPRPGRPPPFARQNMSDAELTNVTPESRAYCAKLIADAVLAPTFTPIGLRPSVVFPGSMGGANWGGASFDPETHTLYVNSLDVAMLYRMEQRPPGSQIPYRVQGLGTVSSRFWDPDMNPCQKPPWGSLTAIDLDRGSFRWQSVLGVVDKLTERGVPPTGAPNIGGSIVTAGGLVFIAATNDSRLRAFDKDTGAELWVTRLPASGHATPMTFRGRTTGRQFVVIAAGGGNRFSATYSDTLVAYALSPSPLQTHFAKTAARYAASAPRPEASDVSLFSHKRHAGLGLECGSCHAERIGFSAVSNCRACHASLPSGGESLRTVVRRLPDFVVFRHDVHTKAVTKCSTCHEDSWAQDTSRPVSPLRMSACVDCHRQRKARTDCTSCHEVTQ